MSQQPPRVTGFAYKVGSRRCDCGIAEPGCERHHWPALGLRGCPGCDKPRAVELFAKNSLYCAMCRGKRASKKAKVA